MKTLKKKCLIFDHDDTLINSQASIHYPIFLETLSELRPQEKHPSFKDFIVLSNQYGFEGYIKQVYGFSEEEVALEIKWWRKKVKERQASIFEDIATILKKFMDAGGILIVYTYSDSSMVISDYKHYFDFVPHSIIGFDAIKHMQKPNRLPVLHALSNYNLTVADCLLVDDMPLIAETASRLNMDMVGACWAEGATYLWNKKHHNIPLCYDASSLANYIFIDQ